MAFHRKAGPNTKNKTQDFIQFFVILYRKKSVVFTILFLTSVQLHLSHLTQKLELKSAVQTRQKRQWKIGRNWLTILFKISIVIDPLQKLKASDVTLIENFIKKSERSILNQIVVVQVFSHPGKFDFILSTAFVWLVYSQHTLRKYEHYPDGYFLQLYKLSALIEDLHTFLNWVFQSFMKSFLRGKFLFSIVICRRIYRTDCKTGKLSWSKLSFCSFSFRSGWIWSWTRLLAKILFLYLVYPAWFTSHVDNFVILF